jgi:hypothetical protein
MDWFLFGDISSLCFALESLMIKKLTYLLLLVGLVIFIYFADLTMTYELKSLTGDTVENLHVIPYADKFKNLPAKYLPITGNQYKSYFLHYCFPGFLPISESDCKREFIAGKDPGIVQVNFQYSLMDNDIDSTFLEASPNRIIYPVPVNVNLEGKTPYLNEYKKRIEYAKKQASYPLVKDIEIKKYKGLNCYKSKGMLEDSRICIPEKYSEYKTKIGNPPVFICLDSMCIIVLDQRNGWVVRATFHADALITWENFYLNLNGSIDAIMER